MLLKGLIIHVGEVYIVEFHTAQLLELLFYTAAHLQRNLKNLFYLFLGKTSVWIHQLQITICHSTYSEGISLIEILTKTEIMVNDIPILFLTKLTYELRKVVTANNQSIFLLSFYLVVSNFLDFCSFWWFLTSAVLWF